MERLGDAGDIDEVYLEVRRRHAGDARPRPPGGAGLERLYSEWIRMSKRRRRNRGRATGRGGRKAAGAAQPSDRASSAAPTVRSEPRVPVSSAPRGRLRWLPLALLVAGVLGFVLWKEFRPLPAPVEPLDFNQVDSQVRPILRRELDAAHADPGSADAHGRLGMVYEANGLWEEAERSFHNASRLAASDPGWALHRGIALAKLGAFEEALALFQAVSKNRAYAPAANFRSGEILLESGRIEEALESFHAALRETQDRVEGYVGLAGALVRNGDHADARVGLERALQIDPSYKQAHYLLGLAYRGLGRKEDARRELARGVASEKRYLPDPLTDRVASFRVNVASQIEYAQVLISSGKAIQGVRILEGLHETRPDDVTVSNNLAIAVMNAGDPERALRILERAKAADPDDFPTWINLAACLLELDRADQALSHAERACELAPEVGATHQIRGKVLAVQGRLEQAYPHLEQSVRLNAQNAGAHFLLGEVYAAIGRYPEARRSFEATLRIDPSHLMANVKLCRVCIELGLFDDAERALARARRQAPASAAVASITELVAERGAGR